MCAADGAIGNLHLDYLRLDVYGLWCMECRDDEIEYRGAPLATLHGDYFHIISREKIDLTCFGCDVMHLIGTEPTYCRECQVIGRT